MKPCHLHVHVPTTCTCKMYMYKNTCTLYLKLAFCTIMTGGGMGPQSGNENWTTCGWNKVVSTYKYMYIQVHVYTYIYIYSMYMCFVLYYMYVQLNSVIPVPFNCHIVWICNVMYSSHVL